MNVPVRKSPVTDSLVMTDGGRSHIPGIYWRSLVKDHLKIGVAVGEEEQNSHALCME